MTEIAPASVDPAYQTKFENKGIDLAKYRAVLQGDVIHDKLQGKIVADVTGSGPQRKVSEIYIQEAAADLPADSIKVRHILYAPKGDPQNASTVPASDPSWAAAQSQAIATYVRLKDDPNLFDAIARKESQETQAQGPSGSGGKLPYFDSGSSVDADFLKAITAPGLKDGDILQPVKSAFGWHVIQVMYHPTDAEHMKALKTAADGGKDFAVLARDNSEAPSAGLGGDLGWVAKGQLVDQLTNAIFATPIGKTSDVGDRRRTTGRTCSRSSPKRPGPPRAGSSMSSSRRPSRAGTTRRSPRSSSPATKPSRRPTPADGRGRCSTRSSRRRGSAGVSIRRTASRCSPRRPWSARRSSRRARC